MLGTVVAALRPVVAAEILLKPSPVKGRVEVLLDALRRRPDDERSTTILELGSHLGIERYEP
jgi:hypothetical protein